MGEITDLIQNYRECARHVWNEYFRELPEGWHEFIKVKDALFHGLVLVQTDEVRHWRAEYLEHGCYPSIRVIPNLAPKGREGLWARGEENEWHWKIIQVTDKEIGLGFVSFFDWNFEGYQDYRYIRCRVQKSETYPELIGADILFPALEVTVHYYGLASADGQKINN